jgi:fructokinase
MKYYGAVEAGGTKFICGIGDETGHLISEKRINTASPLVTLPEVVGYFRDEVKSAGNQIDRIGIGSFGPLELDPNSPTFGQITSTPKPGWSDTDIPNFLSNNLQVKSVIDTDVNAAAYGEYLWGAGRNLESLVYITIGTGIGGGAVLNSRPVHGLVHPEMGHMILKHDLSEDPFQGICPFHNDCFEGLANGPAIKARWNIDPENIPTDHPAWDLEAHYIAQALHSIITILSPQRIILGGGVMQQSFLFPLIREYVKKSVNGYVRSEMILSRMDEYIVLPGLGSRAGVLGALALAISPPK